MPATEKKLGPLDRFRKIFSQSSEMVLCRSKGEVKERSVKDFFENPSNEIHNWIPESCLFSALAYLNDERVVEGKNRVAAKTINLPDGWIEISALADIIQQYRENTGRKTYDGLAYRAYYEESNNIMIIAFRGSTKRAGDWLSNTRWLTRFYPRYDDHYDVVSKQINALIDSAIENTGNEQTTIIATGHSLGGGLATQAAYATDRISNVIAINSSPVTGFYSISPSEREKNKKNVFISRLFEHGEILAIPRVALRSLYRLSDNDPEIEESRFNFGVRKKFLGILQLGQYVTEHSLPLFVDAVWLRVRNKSIFS